MDILLVIIFIFLGICFFILEIFFLPGISIGGIAGMIFSVGGVWYAFAKLGYTAGLWALIIGLTIFLLALFFFIKGKALDRISLKKELLDADPKNDLEKINIGDFGISITRLAPFGRVLIRGEIYDAKSRDKLIDPKEEIKVIAIDGQTLVVECITN